MGDFLYTSLLNEENGEIEHLYSYIGRAAYKHHLSQYQFLRLLDDWRLRLTGDSRIVVSRAYQAGTALCAYGEDVSDVVTALTEATGEKNLQCATFSVLRNALSRRPQGLLKRQRAWCPACYSEARRRGDPVYDRLYWVAADCIRCIFHKIRLIEACPSCGNSQTACSARKGLEYCHKCDQLLIGNAKRWISERKPGYGEKQIIDLIDYIAENPNALFNQFAIRDFHHQMYQLTLGQYSKSENPHIKRGSHERCVFQTVMDIAVHYDISLLLMFQDPLSAAQVAVHSQWPMVHSVRRRIQHTESVRDLLESMLDDAAHGECLPTKQLSLQGICDDVGVSTGYAYYYFPELCRLVRQNIVRLMRNNRAHLRELMAAQLNNGLYAMYLSGEIKRQKQLTAMLATTCGATCAEARRTFHEYHQKMLKGSGQNLNGLNGRQGSNHRRPWPE